MKLLAGAFEVALIGEYTLPRPKTEAPPEITPLADGEAIGVRSHAGTDYVFLSPTPFTFREDDLSFEGTSGLIQLHGDTLVLALGTSGRIAARSHELHEDHAALRTWRLKP